MNQEKYFEIIDNRELFKEYIDDQIQLYPELFPANIIQGWSFYGFVPASKKQGLKIKRIQTCSDEEVWQIHPSFMMPYMVCETEKASKILFLSKWPPC